MSKKENTKKQRRTYKKGAVKISKRKRKLINLKISLKAQKRAVNKKLDSFKGKELTKDDKALRNEIIWRGVQINTQLNENDFKLNKIVKNKKKDKTKELFKKDFDYDVLVYFRVFEKNNLEELVFDSGQITSLNGLKRVKDSEKIYDLISEYWQIMGSKDTIEIRYNEAGEAISRKLGEHDMPDDDDFDIM